MGHDSHDHSHTANETRVFWAMLLTGSFMVAEVVGGVLSGSLALLSDAGHMLADFVSLALAWFAFRLARRKPDIRRSYGYHRFQVLAAFVNGLTLFAIAAWITVEAARRLADPTEVLAGPMLVIAALGLVVNIVSFAILQTGDRENLNMRGAALHVFGDLLGSLAAIMASLIILWTGWMPIDSILSVGVSVLILRTAYTIVRKSGHILLEGTPENVDPSDISEELKAAVPEVTDVHHVHIWSLTSGRPVVTLHAVLADGAEPDDALAAVHRALDELFGLSHATVQIERNQCPDVRPQTGDQA